jgi:signal recognition particle receptor subunit beta
MVFLNYTTMAMTAKIVYYGPGLGGKTTNLQWIHNKTAPRSRGEMVSLETETDRTLFFDLLPLDVGVIGGMKVRLQLYTVPGQVFYNATRRLVLKGVDGVVFVADSQSAALDPNEESIQNLKANLEELGVDQIPVVFQYNKRDLRNILPVDKLQGMLNPSKAPSFEAAAIHGVGVFETLKEISRLALASIRTRIAEETRKHGTPARGVPSITPSLAFGVSANTSAPAPRPPAPVPAPAPVTHGKAGGAHAAAVQAAPAALALQPGQALALQPGQAPAPVPPAALALQPGQALALQPGQAGAAPSPGPGPAENPLAGLLPENDEPLRVEFAEEDTDKHKVRAVPTKENVDIHEELENLRAMALASPTRPTTAVRDPVVEKLFQDLMVSDKEARQEVKRKASVEVPARYLKNLSDLRLQLVFEHDGKKDVMEEAIAVKLVGTRRLERLTLRLDLELKGKG